MIKTAQNTTWSKAGGRGGGMSWEVALKHFLALSEAGPDSDDGAGACQRCWMLDRTIFSPKFLNSVPYPSPAVQFRCLLTFGESVASRIHRAEQQPALFLKFFFFLHSVIQRVLFFFSCINLYTEQLFYWTQYIWFWIQTFAVDVSVCGGVVQPEMLKEESSWCQWKFGEWLIHGIEFNRINPRESRNQKILLIL